jgi:hypothetical protein
MLVISGQNTRTNGWGNQLPVAHARTLRGHVPFRHFRSYNFRSLPIRASSSDVAPPQIWLENHLYTTLVSLIRQLHSVMLQCKPKLGPKISRKLYFLYNVNDLLLVLIINTDLYSLTVLTIALWIFPIIKCCHFLDQWYSLTWKLFLTRSVETNCFGTDIGYYFF